MKYPEPYLRDNSSHYQFKYRSPDGRYRRKSTGATTKRDARAFIKQFMDSLYSHRSLLPLREYAAPFFTWDKCPRTARRRAESDITRVWVEQSRSRLVRLVFPDPISRKPINRISRGDLLDFRQRLIDAGNGTTTINRMMANLSAIFSEAVFRGDLAANPASRISELKPSQSGSPTARDAFTLAELQTLFAENPGHWKRKPAYVTALISATVGLREGEIAALSATQISGNRLTVDRDVERGVVKHWTKNHKPRIVLLPTTLRELIIETGSSGSLLFPSDKGRPRSYTFFRKRLISAMDSADIPKDTPDGTRTFHSLRHTCHSLLTLKYKVDPVAAQLVLGWSSNHLTAIQNRYTHIIDDLRTEVLAASTALLQDILHPPTPESQHRTQKKGAEAPSNIIQFPSAQ